MHTKNNSTPQTAELAVGHHSRRYALLFISLFVNAFGVAFITKAALGTSPISTLPYVLDLFTPCSFGMTTFLQNLVFIAIEVALIPHDKLRKYRGEILIQLPILFVFSFSIDLSMLLLSWMNPTGPWECGISLLVGCVILASGIGWAVKAAVAMNPGEYVVKVIARRLNKPFGTVKLCFDCTLVIMACVTSLVAMHGILGIGIGTIVAALIVGPIERLLTPVWNVFDRWL